MKFLADECVDAGLVNALRVAGYDAIFVGDAAKGILDEQVLAMAAREGRILLTEDKDFGE